MKHTLSRRILSLLLCFSLVLGCAAYRPQKASAVVTETAIAFGLASLIPYAITTGMNLSAISGGADAIASGIQELWDSFYARWKETDASIARSAEDELAYIGGQLLPTYKNGTLTLSDYVVGVYDKFVQWLMGEKGVTEGGDAVEVAKSTSGFSVDTVTTGSEAYYVFMQAGKSEERWSCCESLLYSLGVNSKVAVLRMSAERFEGYYFDDIGQLRIGVFENPYGAVNSAFFGVYDLADLVYLGSGRPQVFDYSWGSGSTYYDCPIFYNDTYARNWSNFLLSDCLAFNHSLAWYRDSSWGTYHYRMSLSAKLSENSDFNTYPGCELYSVSQQDIDGDFGFSSDSTVYCPSYINFTSSTLAAENDDYAAPALAEGKAMQISLNFRAGAPADDEADELPAAIYSAAAAPDDTATGWALTYDVVDADEETTTEPDENTGDDAEEKNEYLPFIPRILDSVKTLPGQIAEKIKDLFVPDEDYAAEFVAELNETYNDRMGLLTYPVSVLADFAQTVATLEEQEPVFRWNAVKWQGETIIAAGEYNLKTAVADTQMKSIYSIYRTVISGVLVIGFLQLCLKKLKEVQRN